jgi:hypothetical protein
MGKDKIRALLVAGVGSVGCISLTILAIVGVGWLFSLTRQAASYLWTSGQLKTIGVVLAVWWLMAKLELLTDVAQLHADRTRDLGHHVERIATSLENLERRAR